MAFFRSRSSLPANLQESLVLAQGISPETIPVINLKEMVANRAASLLWGRGIKIDITSEGHEEAKERLREIIKENELQGLMFEVEKRLSVNGFEFITLEVFNGLPTFALADQRFPQGYGKQLVRPTVAVIFKRYQFDMAEVPTIEVWTEKKVTRQFLRSDDIMLPFLSEEDRKIDNKYKPPKVWKHDMGFLPVWLVKNKPQYGLTSDSDDTAMEYLQLHLNKLTEALYKEIEKNQTRIISTANESELANLGKEGSGFKNLINDYIFQLGNRSDLVKSPLTVLQGDPKISNYISGIRDIVNMYFIGSGYSAPFQDSGKAEQSATQSLSDKAQDSESTRNKRQQRVELLRDMIGKAIEVDKKHGHGDIYPPMEDIEISIPENISASVDDKLRRIQAEIPLGTMSKVTACALMNDITMDEAKKEVERADKEQEAQMEKETQMFAENEGVKNNNPMDEGMPIQD